MTAAAILLVTFAFTAGAMLALWGVSLRKRDASIVDVYWGPGFVAVAWLAGLLSDGATARRLLVCTLAGLWGLRLGAYLLWRNWGAPEDRRYRAMRERHGERFPRVSLFTVFGLQAVLLWLVSLPLQVAQLAEQPARLGWLDGVGTLFWATGFLFESVGDWQLARFKANPDNSGRVMDHGLWRYTRHPNYFGDFMIWWGFYMIALATPHGAWTLLSPVLMSILLLRVSGVTLLERDMQERRPAYRDYVRRTSAFFPLPPRSDA